MDPWTQIRDRIWYYLEEGPASSAVTAEFLAANRYKYDRELEANPPVAVSQPILIIDQSGGQLDLNYSPRYLLAKEEYHITVWSASLVLANTNDLRLKVLGAVESGLPDLGLDSVLDVRLRTGRMTLVPDKIERDADGRLMQWRHDLYQSRQRAVLLTLAVTFLIDRSDLSD